MGFIHQALDWPNFRWDKDKVALHLAKVSKESGFLTGRLSSIGFDAQLGALVETVTQDIVFSSEIEGVALATEEVRSSVARQLGVDIPQSRDSSRYIDGIVDMMLDATTNFNKPLTADRLFGWHNCLFPNGRSGYSVIDVAKYRSSEMKVVSGAFAREKVHYEAPSPDKVSSEMDKFLAWFNSSDTPKSYLKSAIAHLWFVTIHPFDDGNGRIGRAIADMALSEADDSRVRFFSMSKQISMDKKAYYGMLERTQKSDCDITAWLEWYLDCMSRAIASSDGILSRVLNKAFFWRNHADVIFSEREKNVLNIYLDGYIGKVTAKNWANISKVSLDTAARDIKHLMEAGVLEPQPGKVRGVAYGIRCSEDIIIGIKPD